MKFGSSVWVKYVLCNCRSDQLLKSCTSGVHDLPRVGWQCAVIANTIS